MLKITSAIILTVMLSSPIYAEVSPERIERTMQVFASGIDKLLLDTAHVYVSPSDHVKGFHLDKTGVFFTGNISVTASAGISINIDNWAKFFTGIEKSKSTLESMKVDVLTEEDLEVKEEKLEELDGRLEKLDKELSKGSSKRTRVEDEDAKRVAQMHIHIDAFKKELIQTILDFGPILKGIEQDEKLAVALYVKDSFFYEKYNTNYLLVSISFDSLLKIQDLPDNDPKTAKSFKFNI